MIEQLNKKWRKFSYRTIEAESGSENSINNNTKKELTSLSRIECSKTTRNDSSDRLRVKRDI